MKKVITYGTFDLFHRGHYNILKRAKELGYYLIVGVTGESFDIERGKLGVRDSLPKRIENVRATGFADEIIIEEFQGQKVQDVQKYGVDVLAIGSDWRGKFDYLKPYCDVVYLERTKNISSTQIRQSEQYVHFGLMLDSTLDNDFVLESKYVSGVHVDRVFSENAELAAQVCADKELNGFYTQQDDFFDGIDAVYVHEAPRNAVKHIKAALMAGKHVLGAFPFASSAEEIKKLVNIAKEKNVILMPCVRMAYLQAMNQMFWMIESGTIGNVIGMQCSVTDEFDPALTIQRAGVYALYVCERLFKKQRLRVEKLEKSLQDEGRYVKLSGNTNEVSAVMEIGTKIAMPSTLNILGDKGCMTVPDDWWNMGYFEVIQHGEKKKKRYSYNYEGTGMRYILQELLIMLREHRAEPLRFTYEECVALNEVYQSIFGEGKDV